MTNNKDPNQKQPGEKESGTFHYNPGNMAKMNLSNLMLRGWVLTHKTKSTKTSIAEVRSSWRSLVSNSLADLRFVAVARRAPHRYEAGLPRQIGSIRPRYSASIPHLTPRGGRSVNCILRVPRH